MKCLAFPAALLLCCANAAAQGQPSRPRILGILGVSIYVSDAHKSRAFYDTLLAHEQGPKHKKRCLGCEKPPSFDQTVHLNRFQSIGLNPSPSPLPGNLIKDVGFWTDDATALRDYLAANKIDFWSPGGRRVKYVSLTDPEGRRIYFIETDGVLKDSSNQSALSHGGYEHQIIHAGFIVHDRAAMDRFYKDILGFHVYWHGGMKGDETDWVDMQVPDGTDWIEYMLNVPENADKHLLGVMNHIALGVPDVRAAAKELEAKGMKLDEQPQIGRDGKWQLNLYDPDDTRVELMEFTPVEKPCCSEYTGPHPKP